MRAILCDGYGPPERLRLAEVPGPLPGPGDVVIRLQAAEVSSADWRIRTMTMPPGFGTLGRAVFGLRRPRQPILGSGGAGVVAAVGVGVTRFRPGDAVIAASGKLGFHAEARALSESGAIGAKPEALSFAEAAALIFGGGTALVFLRDRARVAAGERVLVNGASGAVGSAAVQIARHLGAAVTAVTSGRNAGLVQGLGAGEVIDYTTRDPLAEPARWDVILDAVGNLETRRALRALRPGGRFLALVAGLGLLLRAPLGGRGGRRILAGPAAFETAGILADLARLADAGVLRPLIDSVHPLEAFRAAHARVETGRKRGSVILALAADGP